MLDAIDIHKVYKDSGKALEVLKGIDLSISPGEIVAVVGPSGAGKSTLLHILGGLDRPSDGIVQLEGKDLYQMPDQARSRLRNQKIGFVFQFYHLLPEFTALENVVLPLLIQKGQGGVRNFEDVGRTYLNKVGLAQRAGHKPNQLSGGEQQRVAIARALVNEPSLIFCDEPTGNLDSESGKEIIDLLLELNRTNNQTLVIVTHDEGIAKLAKRVIYMRDGILLH